MTGVSPAYFISRYTDRFTPANMCEGLAEIADLGFEQFQPEVFHAANLADWVNGGGQQVRQCSDGLKRLCDQLNTDTLGLNYDTGHAWAGKENLCMIPAKLNGKIFGTHFCDNFGHENLSLRPGKGSINWPQIIEGLQISGYQGSFDVEIICPPEAVRQEYREAREFIESILGQTYPPSVD